MGKAVICGRSIFAVFLFTSINYATVLAVVPTTKCSINFAFLTFDNLLRLININKSIHLFYACIKIVKACFA